MSNIQGNPPPTNTQVNDIVNLALNSPSAELRAANETQLLNLRSTQPYIYFSA